MSNEYQGGYTRRQELTCTEAQIATYADIVLHLNEKIYVRMNSGVIRMKLGDGVTSLRDLPYTKIYDGTLEDVEAMLNTRLEDISGVLVSPEEPTNPDVSVWIDPDENEGEDFLTEADIAQGLGDRADMVLSQKAASEVVDTVKNLADGKTKKSLVLNNGYIVYTTGVEGLDSTGAYQCSGFINIANAKYIEHNCAFAGTAGYAFYNESKVYISGGNLPMVRDIPESAFYMRITDYNENAEHENKEITVFFGEAFQIAEENKKRLEKIVGKRIGVVATNENYSSGNFLNNSGSILTGSGYAIYSVSNEIPVTVGEKLFIPYTYSLLNSQLGGYYKDGVWVASLGESTPTNGYYEISLSTEIDYDAVRVNIHNASTITTDFTVYINEKGESKIYLADDVIVKSEAIVYGWKGKKWVALGDSWTEGAYYDTCGRYTDYVSAYLGMECTNLGVGGSGIQVFADNLTDEIAANADLITVWGSINNMATGGIACGTIEDEASASGTLMARWKYTLDKILSKNPMCKIVIIGCPVSLHANWSGYGEYNSSGDTIEKSVEMIGKLANRYGLPFVNMFKLAGFNTYNFNGGTHSNNANYFDYDRVHPNNNGVKRVANILTNELLKMQPLEL